MKPESIRISEIWGNIETVGKPLSSQEIQYFELPVGTINGPLRVAIDPDKKHHLLVEVAADTDVIGDTRSRGIQIAGKDLEDDTGMHRFIDVTCLMPELNNLFDDILADMVEAIEADNTNPAKSCRDVLGNWRRFIEGASEPVLGKALLCGLFGELCYLEKIMLLGTADPLSLWRGWDGSSHDFVRDNHALEVKGSLARDGRICQINGIRQLLAPEHGSLLLGYLKFELTDHGRSVPDLIEALTGGGINRFDLMDCLKAVGYQAAHNEHYETVRFSLIEDRLYEVTADFPRIVPESFASGGLPAGVSNFVYSIDLLSEPPFPVPDADIDQRMTEFSMGSTA